MRTSCLKFARTTLWLFLFSGSITAVDLRLANAEDIDGWDVFGMHGELLVQGALTEPTCVLEMESKEQSVKLGPISRVSLNRVGNRTDPVA
ncbi:MAG: fimbrial protein, partial [Hafnia alvei]